MIGKLAGLRGRSLSRRSFQLLNETLAILPRRLETLVSGANVDEIANLSKEYSDVSGLKELSLGGDDARRFSQISSEMDSRLFRSLLSKPDYTPRLQQLITLSDIIGSGFDDVSDADKASWLRATGAIFPLSAFLAYTNLVGEMFVDTSLPSEAQTLAHKLLPALLYAEAREQLKTVKTTKEDQDNSRVARLEEGLRVISPSLRDLAFSKTRQELNLTGIKNLYSRTFGEVFATAIVTVPSNLAPSMTYGVEKRAQLLFVLEYCARNLGTALRILEEYELLSGASLLIDKPIIPNPSVFLAILRREMTRSKIIEKAIGETEKKLHNQAFIYYSEAGRTLSRLPLKTRPQMVRFLKAFKRKVDECHLSFRVDQIPSSLKGELVQFLTVTK